MQTPIRTGEFKGRHHRIGHSQKRIIGWTHQAPMVEPIGKRVTPFFAT
jgi:hypothetical protein